MNHSNIFSRWRLGILVIITLVIVLWPPAASAAGITLIIDGKKAQADPAPVIKNDRTLIPVRLVSESLGAQVEWREDTRTVHIAKGNRAVVLRIDNRLVDYRDGETTYSLCDVPPQILDNRTFVPLRLVGNALGVEVAWDGTTRTVTVDSNKPAAITPLSEMGILNIRPGQVVRGATQLQVGFGNLPPAGAAEVRFQLLDPETGRGPVIARGNELNGSYRWLPDPAVKGTRLLAAGIYNTQGHFLTGHVLPVEMAVAPQVILTGVASGQTVSGGVPLGSSLNFVADYVKYEITYQASNNTITTDEADPWGTYQWTPQLSDNGEVSIRAIAYDRMGQSYYSPLVSVQAAATRQLELRGVPSGGVINKPVTLWAFRNFAVSQTEYLLIDSNTGKEEVLAQTGYTGLTWFPGPEKAGTWQLAVRVKDTMGKAHTSAPVYIKVTAEPKLLVQTVGPNQILTGEVKLKSLSNVGLSKIEYQLINPKTGVKKVIASSAAADVECAWTPVAGDSGSWKIQAVGSLAAGGKVTSEEIPVKVYLGKIFAAQPIIEKSQFKDYVSAFAVESQTKTGMSAALQVAQAILETGWGQSTPVDKYSGQLSNNLFGIKGRGPAGAVISNTWEEYNGNTFRVDAEFRAYNNPAQSWADHKNFLLTGARYEPYRAVMHDSVMGAWALKRAGYATDSKYPLKLINLMKTHDLFKLDDVGI